MRIRPYETTDFAAWKRMRTAFWADQTEADMAMWLARNDAAVLLAVNDDVAPIGFVEVGERNVADACATSPVGYVEGWWVDPAERNKGVGRALIRAAEDWARNRGLTEMASDADLDNTISQAAHERLGYTETFRVVNYR